MKNLIYSLIGIAIWVLIIKGLAYAFGWDLNLGTMLLAALVVGSFVNGLILGGHRGEKTGDFNGDVNYNCDYGVGEIEGKPMYPGKDLGDIIADD